jgi:hypothetical protein
MNMVGKATNVNLYVERMCRSRTFVEHSLEHSYHAAFNRDAAIPPALGDRPGNCTSLAGTAEPLAVDMAHR